VGKLTEPAGLGARVHVGASLALPGRSVRGLPLVPSGHESHPNVGVRSTQRMAYNDEEVTTAWEGPRHG